MDRLKRFALFWYDFVVGDDWLLAAGVLIALAITWSTVRLGITDWVWLPLLVIVVLATSLWRATAKLRG
jgi:hypothetical protein